MLEIYNEIVRDLLNPGGDRKRGLKVREHPKKGFYGKLKKKRLKKLYIIKVLVCV